MRILRFAHTTFIYLAALYLSFPAMAWITIFPQADGNFAIGKVDPTTTLLASKSPRDKDGVVVIPWYFDPTYPFTLPQNAKSTPKEVNTLLLLKLQKGMHDWQSVCNIRFEYKGEKSYPDFKNDPDGATFANSSQELYVNIYGSIDNTSLPFYASYSGPRKIHISSYSVYQILTRGLILETQAVFDQRKFTHELGHTLGLDHSNDTYSVMIGDPTFTNPQLDGLLASPNVPIDQQRRYIRPDDIAGCQAIYGKPKKVSDEVKAEALFNVAEMAYPDYFPARSYKQGTNPAQPTQYTGTAPRFVAKGPYVKTNTLPDIIFPQSAVLEGFRFRRYTGPLLPLRYFKDYKVVDDYYSKLYPGYKPDTGWVDVYKECPKGYAYLAVKDGDVYYYNDARPQDGIINVGPVDDILNAIRSDTALRATEVTICQYLTDQP